MQTAAHEERAANGTLPCILNHPQRTLLSCHTVTCIGHVVLGLRVGLSHNGAALLPPFLAGGALGDCCQEGGVGGVILLILLPAPRPTAAGSASFYVVIRLLALLLKRGWRALG